MLTQKRLFYQYLAQTSPSPIELEIERAEGIYLYDRTGKSYVDLISGVAVNNVGHSHPAIIEAIQNQLKKHMHLMVYGEYIQSPQVQFAQALSENLPECLQSFYFVNSGSEAVEGAIKLAKRYTGRSEIIYMKNAYHGSTSGALSIMGGEEFRYAFRPLLPNTRQIAYNNLNDLDEISSQTACVILDPLQSEAGLHLPENDYLHLLRNRCTEKGVLLVFDEVQTGLGRTGSLFYFEQSATPDILVLAKALGGGMPLGAFISSKQIMDSLMSNPVLGHITTFGGHPVSCAAGLASLRIILAEKLHKSADEKGKLFAEKLSGHPKLKAIRQKGLFLACDLEDEETYWKLLKIFIHNGLVTDSFLFKLNSFRIAPPLNITYAQIEETAKLILKSLDEL